MPGQQADDWKVPRPHHDGWYWDKNLDNGREQFKIGAVLLGPGTLLCDTDSLDEERRKKAHSIVSRECWDKAKELDLPSDDIAVRQWIADELDKLEVPRFMPRRGECIRWIVGDDQKAGIHSEPDMSDMPKGRIL